MSLKAANKTDTNTYTVEITVDAETFNKAVNDAYLKQRGSINLPGFRKGKAPRSLIEKYYGSEVFYEDALDAVFSPAVMAAYEEAGIDAVDSPYDFDIKYMNVTEGVDIEFKVTVKPEVTLKQYKGISAEKAAVKVTKEEISEELDRMLERSARIVDVDDRAVKDGDIAVIDFEGFVDGVAFDGGKAEKYSLTIGSGSFIPGFEEQIIGHEIGEEFDVNVTFPEEYAPELASKAAVFKIKLHEIKVKELPELDDEFAKDLGEYDTVEELKKGVEEDILKRKTEDADRAFEDAVLTALAENVEAEIPECMFDNKAKENVDSFAQRIAQQGIDLDTYLSYMGMTREAFEASAKEQSVNQVKLDLAVEAVIKLEGIKASDERIDEEYAKMAEMYQIDVEKIKEIIASKTVAEQIEREEAVKFVVDNAKAKKPAAKKAAKAKEEGEAEEKAEKKPAAKKTAKAADGEAKPAAKKKAAPKKAAENKEEAAE